MPVATLPLPSMSPQMSRTPHQLAIFFCSITNNFYTHEEFVQLVPMKANTNGANILAAVLLWVEDFGLDLAQLCGM